MNAKKWQTDGQAIINGALNEYVSTGDVAGLLALADWCGENIPANSQSPAPLLRRIGKQRDPNCHTLFAYLEDSRPEANRLRMRMRFARLKLADQLTQALRWRDRQTTKTAMWSIGDETTAPINGESIWVRAAHEWVYFLSVTEGEHNRAHSETCVILARERDSKEEWAMAGQRLFVEGRVARLVRDSLVAARAEAKAKLKEAAQAEAVGKSEHLPPGIWGKL